MGAIGAVAEPLVVIALLFGGTWLNRDKDPGARNTRRRPVDWRQRLSDDDLEAGNRARSFDGLLEKHPLSPTRSDIEPKYHKRVISIFGLKKEVTSPNTRRFQSGTLSRLLERFPFLVECWYWALIYWVYQLGRAFTATLINTSVVTTARLHALTVIRWEQDLHIFIEPQIQAYFLAHPVLLTWINRIYSFIHIPGSIAFLVFLFHHTISRNASLRTVRPTLKPSSPRLAQNQPWPGPSSSSSSSSPSGGAALYQSRRRTMALSNLLAFVVFTLWPCMPPRLLSDPTVEGETGELARSFGFVDTVHGAGGEGSVWTENRFCNQYAAMPSLHFGYALLIGFTVMTIPLAPSDGQGAARSWWMSRKRRFAGVRLPRCDWRRVGCVFLGVAYPATILVAIVATANHFILDAVAGSCVCTLAWWNNDALLNLLPLEDWFLWAVRIHKPELETVEWGDD